jgi:hypothetical protein
MKICRLVFSTNRLEYLIPTLESHKDNIDFGDHEVHSILIDDYPFCRNNDKFIQVAKDFGFNELVLHEENRGLTLTWTQSWKYISENDFDYVWHHEDDVVFTEQISIDTMINFLKKYPAFCQVNLKRQPWYTHELNETPKLPTDQYFEKLRFNVRDDFFWSMASLYPTWICKEPIVEVEGCNLAEYSIMKYMREQYHMKMAILKRHDGEPLVEHIGFYSQGKRVLPGEPGWEGFKMYDPNKRYDSKTGKEYK